MNETMRVANPKLHSQKPHFFYFRSLNLTTICILLFIATPVSANKGSVSNKALTEALEEIKRVDGKGRVFSYSIAILGTAIGLGIGGWALHQQPLTNDGTIDPVVLGSSMIITGAGLSQIVHGGMRYDERGISAQHAGELLNDLPAKKDSAVLYLRDRAAESESTRFWGAVMTTSQGLATGTLGVRLWTKGQDGIQTTGIVMTVVGALNTAVGLVHFFGKTRTGRILDRVLKTRSSHSSLEINPTLLPADQSTLVPGLSASSVF